MDFKEKNRSLPHISKNNRNKTDVITSIGNGLFSTGTTSGISLGTGTGLFSTGTISGISSGTGNGLFSTGTGIRTVTGVITGNKLFRSATSDSIQTNQVTNLNDILMEKKSVSKKLISRMNDNGNSRDYLADQSKTYLQKHFPNVLSTFQSSNPSYDTSI